MVDLTTLGSRRHQRFSAQKLLLVIGVVGLIWAPFFIYPIFVMKVLCFALFACAFNLLLGYAGLLSFGHATFFGGAAYFTAYAVTEASSSASPARRCSAWSWASSRSDGRASTSP